MIKVLTLIITLLTVPLLMADSVVLILDSDDGSSTFSCHNSDTIEMASIDSDGNVQAKGCMRLDSSGIKCTAAENLVVDGKIGIGIIGPSEKLEVNGAIKINVSSGNADGTIRYAGGNFEGRKTGVWTSLTESIPVGSVLPFGGNVIPNGYVICDGSSLLRTGTYAELFAVIGTAYGATDGTHFNVPDLRGKFVRGVDNGAGNDPDAATRTASNPGGNAGDNLGSMQSHACKQHSHESGTLTADNGGIHTHSLGTLSTNTTGAHIHGNGTLSTNTTGTHVHGTGTLATSTAANHSHGPGSLTTDNAGTHTHTEVRPGNQFAARSLTAGGNVSEIPVQAETHALAGAHTHAVSGSSASIGNHPHSITGSMASIGDHSHPITGGIATGGDHSHALTGVFADSVSHTHTISGNTDNSGSSETRPDNVYVNFIIKY